MNYGIPNRSSSDNVMEMDNSKMGTLFNFLCSNNEAAIRIRARDPKSLRFTVIPSAKEIQTPLTEESEEIDISDIDTLSKYLSSTDQEGFWIKGLDTKFSKMKITPFPSDQIPIPSSEEVPEVAIPI